MDGVCRFNAQPRLPVQCAIDRAINVRAVRHATPARSELSIVHPLMSTCLPSNVLRRQLRAYLHRRHLSSRTGYLRQVAARIQQQRTVNNSRATAGKARQSFLLTFHDQTIIQIRNPVIQLPRDRISICASLRPRAPNSFCLSTILVLV
jgi:hypothetical protein